jgi:hypothetical protein
MLLENQVTIPANSNTSNGVMLGRIPNLVAIELPTMTSNKIHLEVSTDGSAWERVYANDGTLYEIKPTAGWNYLPHDVSTSLPPFVRIFTNGTESAERIIKLFSRQL